MKTRYIIICVWMLLAGMTVRAQESEPQTVTDTPKIKIGGNVYGGGNAGNMTGKTSVTVRAGNIEGSVFGGARQANVGGQTFVNIDGAHISDDITINRVFGGNDISGTIGTSSSAPSGVNQNGTYNADEIKTFNAFVLTTAEKEAGSGETQHHIFIGQLFGGGNGDYDYTTQILTPAVTTTNPETGEVTVVTPAVENSYYGMPKPELAKAFVDIHGGTFGYVFGGGNNATVTKATNICIKNTSDVTHTTDALDLTQFTNIEDLTGGSIDNPVDKRLMDMGINISTFRNDFQFLAVFGGNNKAPMHIRPKWHLDKGSIYNLYSGGNEGKMTSSDGLLLEINEDSEIIVENVYGGCRKANVEPLDKRLEEGGQLVPYIYNLTDVDAQGKKKYYFPDGFAARVLITGGDITNVYGGNDISGKVFYGNAVGVSTSIKGDIYGGGNGSYAYTDQESLKNDLIWGDYYYDPTTASTTLEALNAHRPNAEQVSVHVGGKANKPTIISGSIYCGGNSATIKPGATIKTPRVELKIGSYVIADKAFLGNNGVNMIDASANGVLAKYAGKVYNQNKVLTQFSSLGENPAAPGLKDATNFATYMDGCAMNILPTVVFDKHNDDDTGDRTTYEEYTSYFGSFFCGGNVGSIKKDGKETVNFNHKVIIFNKLVGGCNTAYVPMTNLNAAYEGGLIGNPNTSGDKLELNLSGLKLQPKRWRIAEDGSGAYKKDSEGNYIKYYDPTTEQPELEWNTVKNTLDAEGNPIPVAYNDNEWAGENSTMKRRFDGANIYGGCYTSGYVNGNVVININGTIVDREGEFGVFDTATPVKTDEDKLADPEILYGHTKYKISTVRSGVILNEQGMDPLGLALNVFGGGYGEESEIRGSTTINLNAGYTFQIFGGGEKGALGYGTRNENGELIYNKAASGYDSKYSTTINVNGVVPGLSKSDWNNLSDEDKEAVAECEFIYGGGFEGLICGDTRINIGNCRLFNTFAGSCNADILGHTETYVGQWTVGSGETATTITGFPWIRDHIYGGNDLGGQIKGSKSFTDRVNTTTLASVYGAVKTTSTPEGSDTPVTTTDYPVLNASAYVEYVQGRVVNIFGGCYGDYDYNDEAYSSRVGTNKPYLHNAFVNIRPINTTTQSADPSNRFEKAFGAGQGHSGDRDGDKMQDRSYVLVDIPANMSNFRYSEFFGAGSYDGLGMRYTYDNTTTSGFNLDDATAVIDLVHGKVGAAYGGSFNEGFTRRTMVNVPNGSTIDIGSIFGGAYGNATLLPCDVYEAHVEYHSADALLYCDPDRKEKVKDPETNVEKEVEMGDRRLRGAIYGGNNRERRTIYGKINITTPVRQNHYKYGLTTGTVYGAGCGSSTWSEYTEVNLEKGAEVYEVYGGGEEGRVLNAESVQKYMKEVGQTAQGATNAQWLAAWKIGSGYFDPTQLSDFSNYVSNTATNLNNPAMVRTAEMDNRPTKTYKYNTNVIINKGATVNNYAYGGGLGSDKIAGSGDVYGTTYIALLGGCVAKDIFAAGTVGAVYDAFSVSDPTKATFTASANAYIEGGTLRNVYGGGWKGDVGYTPMDYTSEGWSGTYEAAREVPGETNVVIGIRKDQATLPDGYGFLKGDPAIQRNAYAGGEGGAVFGTANLVLNNGHIGYVYLLADEEQNDKGEIVKSEVVPAGRTARYEDKIDDETYKKDGAWAGKDRLKDCGNVFGGGYDVRSCVDHSNITMWGGVVRNSMHGGGEIATIGRGAVEATGASNSLRTLNAIYSPGSTHIEMYNGHVKRNVFGGGKGYNLFGYGQVETLYTDGYVFGKTEVYIRGGEIGTKEGVADGYGNVFGGGDIGFVYSGSCLTGNHTQGTGSPDHYYYYDSGDHLTEDCKVVVSPYLQVKEGQTVSTYSAYQYVPTDYLNTLPKKTDNQWTGDWLKLYTGANSGVAGATDDTEERGVIIHNAVFGGGNVASNSDTQYANSKTVFGNVTATLYDVYHRDFITVGTEHIGGIYGGGNFSLVDGYRELNITNYGTDYYGLNSRISLEKYRELSNRERAYFQLEYVCTASSETNNGKTGIRIGGEFYETGQHLSEEKYLKLIEAYPSANVYWEPFGFCSIYAGRLLNTIQRADFCGVYGSRMVLQGAKDRVADVGEKIDYTINRVGEVSLNKKRSLISTDTGEDAEHGNYFGIYSVVNCMGNLTSDINFDDDYIKPDGTTDSEKTFYSYKAGNYTSLKRNKGTSINQVALASGVFLELTTEKSTATHKDYGLITGVVGLDLINVKTSEEGGGFVYAKNEHRVPRYYPEKENVLLSEYNKHLIVNGVEIRDEARTYKRYRYYSAAPGDWSDPNSTSYVISGNSGDQYTTMPYQTSGNFIHKSKDIVDDCYPTNNAYIIGSANYSEAHYWYIKGSVYIYDQKVSAHTGSANAYSKEVHLPLTITAASHGKLQLLNVKPNLYAYYTPVGLESKGKIGAVKDANDAVIDKVTVNNESDSYQLNDVITWWDWHQLTYKERQYFVPETSVNCVALTIDGKLYEIGEYVLENSPSIHTGGEKTDYEKFVEGEHTVLDADGETVTDLTTVFRSSNNIGHDTGYVLTLDMNSPKVWDDYYSPASGPSTYTVNADGTISTTRKTEAEYEALFTEGMTEAQKQTIRDAWREGPTFTPKATGIYGKHTYNVGDIVTKTTYENAAEGQENMEPAYVAKESVTYTYGGVSKTVNKGTAISETEHDEIGSAQSSFAPAKICTTTLKITDDTYMLYGQLYYGDEITALKNLYTNNNQNGKDEQDIDDILTDAYYCTVDGEYGGQTLTQGNNYSALQAWSSLYRKDRIDNEGNDRFTYNYDALDLLADDDYLVVRMEENDSPAKATTAAAFHSPYTDETNVEYQAVFQYEAYGNDHEGNRTLSYDGGSVSPSNPAISNEIFETKIRNDKRHYTRVSVKAGGETVYIATSNFIYKGIPYGKGQIVDSDVYEGNTDTSNSKVEAVAFAGLETEASIWYYCYENYDNVSKGVKITESDYAALRNDQQYFIIQGKEPTETTTLYVSSESDIKDLTKERIYTVVYQYTYYENEDDGSIKLSNELHVINIHLELESGVPIVGQLKDAPLVLPGSPVGLMRPDVNNGLYEPLANGWELFDNWDDALHHRNGKPFINNGTPVYWYQNQTNYVAFYSQTYIGRSYSNPVPLAVANYHDLDDVMKDKENHMYVDRSDVDRPSKIYIDNRTCESDPTKNELDLLKDFFDLSLVGKTGGGGYTVVNDKITGTTGTANSSLVDHAVMNSHVHAGRNLEFILSSDIDHSTKPNPDYDPEDTENPQPARIPAPWTPIGDNATTGDSGGCFEGILHGDGHTISGLDHSLFNYLCGEVYNLGVTGTFTDAGIAHTGSGYVENCWVKTTSASDKTEQPIFGDPSRAANDERGQVQVVNSYYKENDDEAYTKDEHDNVVAKPGSYTKQIAEHNVSDHGIPIRKDDRAFYNGEVAYDLNGFYLKKRYYHGINLAEGEDNTYYLYLHANPDGSLPETMTTGYYPYGYAVYRPVLNAMKNPIERAPYMGYVESRFYDGDFRYAAGSIPDANDIRQRTREETVITGEGVDAVEEKVEKIYYTPIWPDDYLFFGQTLTYDHIDGEEGRIKRVHQDLPTIVNRSNGRILESTSDKNGNRVYRAPAYFRSGDMDVAHFNSYAVFAATKKNVPAEKAYEDMTAIDFTGHKDVGSYVEGWADHQVSSPYWTINSTPGSGAFYPPLLDDDGLSGFQNIDLTQNLLAYTMTSTDAAAKTNAAVGSALPDETYEETASAPVTDDYTDTYRYHTVAYRDPKFVKGHHVQLTNSKYMALNDHLLVDKQDFNAPIEYKFDSDKLMWYQRKPDNYVGKKKPDGTFIDSHSGWEGISIPFKAEIVTTNEKGEITHFYDNLNTNNVGHEYWLRGFNGGAISASDEKVFEANFKYPMYNVDDGTKWYKNTFLWDFYYSYNDYDDWNYDDYQEKDTKRTYYKMIREYGDYPRLAGGMPYIIGFPGERYYEFDLSGAFTPENTVEDRSTGWPQSKNLNVQTITFASKPGATIGVSDLETVTNENGVEAGVTKDGYIFKANYLKQKFEAGTAKTYTLNSAGNSYEIIPAAPGEGEDPVPDTEVAPFRPYFKATAAGGARQLTRAIVFSNEDSQLKGVDDRDLNSEDPGLLKIYAKKHKIVVESALTRDIDVRIVNAAGITVANFNLEPGETVETRINSAGVYIVQSADSRYTKKLVVK